MSPDSLYKNETAKVKYIYIFYWIAQIFFTFEFE